MEKEGFFREHKIFTTFLVIILLTIATFFIFRAYLYFQYLIGNDLVIKLEANRKDISLDYGQSENIRFEISKITNPLCRTECQYKFVDISKNITIVEGSFILNQMPQSKEEKISPDKQGTGKKIYRYSVACNNIETFFCHSGDTPVSRDILIIMSYQPNEQQILANKVMAEKIYKIFNETDILLSNLNYLQSKIIELNSSLFIEIDSNTLSLLNNETINHFSRINEEWQQENYEEIEKYVYLLEINKEKLKSAFNYLNTTASLKIQNYNLLISKLHAYALNLTQLINRSAGDYDCQNSESLVQNFNLNLELFSKTTDIQSKTEITRMILQHDLYNYTIENCTFKTNATISFNLSPIQLIFPNGSSKNFSLKEPLPQCCVYNECRTCKISDKSYPILFIHGHDFDKDISAEYSLNVFQKIQNKLDTDGYLNAGQITLYEVNSEKPGRLGYFGVPVTIRSTYYYDVLKESASTYLPVQTKSENIDTYSIKLKALIDKLKYETGQTKVIIIAHSMGGLVARRYIQLFGNESVDKLIMIATPNKGIVDDIASLCSIFGAKKECDDLTYGSLFLNKLNNDPAPYVKTYNIIGVGCDMKGEDGDGIVIRKNAEIDSAEQYYINGFCSGIDLLHNQLLDPEKYPALYDKIKKILKEK